MSSEQQPEENSKRVWVVRKKRREEDFLAEKKLSKLIESALLLNREQNGDVLLKHILNDVRDIAHCETATLYLKTDRDTLAFALRTNSDTLPVFELPLFNADGTYNEKFVVTHAATHNETIVIDDVYTETRFDLAGTKKFSEDSGMRVVSMLTVPLALHDGEVLGVLQLLNAKDERSGESIPFASNIVNYVEAMAAQSAVALQSKRHIESQKLLIDSLINLITVAIDAKSPYTGGHCERVPELALMMAEEAAKVDTGPLADFNFKNADEWYEFRVGAMLHDCGKVTTPEYVADKATKLETLYNRIHEIRMRFEVLLRDARLARLEAIIAGTPEAEADAAFAARKQQLDEDFAFLANCNIGAEFTSEEQIDRIKEIGAQTWLRHFDDKLGLSNEEMKRYKEAATELPALERLLADKESHIAPRPDSKLFDPKYKFKIKIPQHLNNFGEIYNLSIDRGTLNAEERFKINEHILQTTVMLETLSLPKNLKRVPEYASSHHETMIGTGYPRGLAADELSIPARIMTIADIFEALTASDRPYKKSKSLSESVKILFFFKKDGLIDPVLFDLFLTSGVYRRFGERFLSPEQLDDVDISKYIG
jgi:HD-GYP domain-containing protein (c-di-GMP phosphodiesterase class II)